MTSSDSPIGRAGPPAILARMIAAIRLAGPVIASRAGFLSMVVVDVAMLGRLGSDEIARYSLGLSPTLVMLLVGVGLLFGTVVRVSHARGEGDPAACGRAWRHAVPYALLLGLVMLALTTQAQGFLTLVGQDPGLAAGAASVALIFGAGLAPTFLYFACAFLLEGLKRPALVVWAVVLANAINMPLTVWLMGGGWGVPALGADGAALATVIARALAALFLVWKVWTLADRDSLHIRGPFLAPGWWTASRTQRRHGYAAGIAQGCESAAFNAMLLFAGWLGPAALAAYAAAINLTAMLFMVAIGLATATAVQVGHAHGARDWAERAAVGWTGAVLIVASMGAFAVLLYAFPGPIATVYTADPAIVDRLIPLFAVMAAFLVMDGLQVVMNQACRGAGDAWVPTVLVFVTFLTVMLPAGYWFAFPLGLGETGLFLGILVSTSAAALALTARWIWIAHAPRNRAGQASARARITGSPGRP